MRKVALWRPPLWLVAGLMIVSLSLGPGWSLVRGAAGDGACTELAEVCAKFTQFWKVWNLAETRFVDPKAVNPDDMITGAINGMLDSLGDQGHTRYLTAEQVKRFSESLQGSFEGIGAFVNTENGVPIIVAPIEGSPAEAAGVRPGDVIVRVNGNSTEGLVIDEVVALIRGKAGTSVTITVRHVGEEATEEMTITRAAVTVPATAWTMLPGNIALIRLTQFSDNAAEAVQGRLDEAKAAGATAIIFDVRDNPGGLLSQATAVTGLFVKKGEVVLRESVRDGEEKVYRSQTAEPQLDLPMVVLINGGSASSAEIFAGALQDYGRATLIGVPTAGTGTVLSTLELQDKAALLLGTGQWLTPKGRYLRREGVAPDLTVALPAGVRGLTPTAVKQLKPEQLTTTKDSQLLRAMKLLGVGGEQAQLSRFAAR